MLSIIQSLVDYIFKLLPQADLLNNQAENVKIIAHRGCHENEFTENTMDAFIWCIENGMWGIEFDVHFTIDNVPVIHHDAHCGRLFGRADLIIAKTNFKELHESIPQIPTLDEVVSECGIKIHLMMEIKSKLTSEQNRILTMIFDGLKPKVDYHILSLSMDHFSSITFVESDCFVPVSEVNLKEVAKQALEKRYAGVAGHYLFFNDAITAPLTSLKIETGVGFIASKNSLKREIHKNHNWIFTDMASSAKDWLNQLIIQV